MVSNNRLSFGFSEEIGPVSFTRFGGGIDFVGLISMGIKLVAVPIPVNAVDNVDAPALASIRSLVCIGAYP